MPAEERVWVMVGQFSYAGQVQRHVFMVWKAVPQQGGFADLPGAGEDHAREKRGRPVQFFGYIPLKIGHLAIMIVATENCNAAALAGSEDRLRGWWNQATTSPLRWPVYFTR